MADFVHTFEGSTNGTQLTVANSGSGGDSAFASSGVLPATAVWTFSSTGKITGLLGGRISFAVSTTWGAFNTITTSSLVAARWGFTFNTTVINTMLIATLVEGSTFGSSARAGVDGTGHLMVQDAAGTVLSTAAGALSANTAYYVELQVNVGTTTVNGTINCQLYTAAAPGSLLLNYASGATVNAGAGKTLIRGQLGNQDTLTALDLTFDDVLYRTGTTTPVGPPVVAGIPDVAMAPMT